MRHHLHLIHKHPRQEANLSQVHVVPIDDVSSVILPRLRGLFFGMGRDAAHAHFLLDLAKARKWNEAGMPICCNHHMFHFWFLQMLDWNR